MAFNDTLFQLGMDLTRSSTAQKEDHGDVARVAHNDIPVRHAHEDSCARSAHEDRLVRVPHEDRKDFFIERDGVKFAGTHLIIDLFGARRLDDLAHIERTLKRCIEVAGATLLHIHLHHFTPNGGVSGVAVLSESHISIHSWPEADYAALDVFMCGDAKPELAVPVLKEAFSARKVEVKDLKRGEKIEEARWQIAAERKAPIRMAKPAKARKAA